MIIRRRCSGGPIHYATKCKWTGLCWFAFEYAFFCCFGRTVTWLAKKKKTVATAACGWEKDVIAKPRLSGKRILGGDEHRTWLFIVASVIRGKPRLASESLCHFLQHSSAHKLEIASAQRHSNTNPRNEQHLNGIAETTERANDDNTSSVRPSSFSYFEEEPNKNVNAL